KIQFGPPEFAQISNIPIEIFILALVVEAYPIRGDLGLDHPKAAADPAELALFHRPASLEPRGFVPVGIVDFDPGTEGLEIGLGGVVFADQLPDGHPVVHFFPYYGPIAATGPQK